MRSRLESPLIPQSESTPPPVLHTTSKPGNFGWNCKHSQTMNSNPPSSFTNVHKYLRNSKQCERNVQRVNASNVFMQTRCEFLGIKTMPCVWYNLYYPRGICPVSLFIRKEQISSFFPQCNILYIISATEN